MKSLAFSKDAIRALKRAPTNTAAIIRSKIDQYVQNPASLANNVTKLQGRSGHRLRIGDWRVVFTEDDATVSIVAIGPRGGVYG